jgi:hypothetical protein
VVTTPLTVFLAKLIGLYCVLFGLAMVAQKQAMLDIVAALIRNGPVLLIIEAIGVTVGLAIVLGHNVWSGGALPIVVTLLGWITLIRGVVLLFLSPERKVCFFEIFRFAEQFYLYAGITLVLGAYLTIAGFTS